MLSFHLLSGITWRLLSTHVTTGHKPWLLPAPTTHPRWDPCWAVCSAAPPCGCLPLPCPQLKEETMCWHQQPSGLVDEWEVLVHGGTISSHGKDRFGPTDFPPLPCLVPRLHLQMGHTACTVFISAASSTRDPKENQQLFPPMLYLLSLFSHRFSSLHVLTGSCQFLARQPHSVRPSISLCAGNTSKKIF